MGGVVVQAEVDLQVLGHLPVDDLEEFQPFLMPVLRRALADDHAGQHVQRGEQGGGAVALVVVGHRAGATFLHRQAGWVRSRAWICDSQVFYRDHVSNASSHLNQN